VFYHFLDKLIPYWPICKAIKLQNGSINGRGDGLDRNGNTNEELKCLRPKVNEGIFCEFISLTLCLS
jgi:hypothetical protein